MDRNKKKELIEKVKKIVRGEAYVFDTSVASIEGIIHKLDALLDDEPKDDPGWVAEIRASQQHTLLAGTVDERLLRIVRRIRAAEIRKKAKELRGLDWHSIPNEWEADADRLEGKQA